MSQSQGNSPLSISSPPRIPIALNIQYNIEWNRYITVVNLSVADALTNTLWRLRSRMLQRLEFGIAANFTLKGGLVNLPSAPAARAQKRLFRVIIPSGIAVRAHPEQMSTVIGGLHKGTVFDVGMFSINH